MKNKPKIFILIILLLFLLSPPLKLNPGNRDNIQIATATPIERVDNTTYTIYFAKAVPSVSESNLFGYHFAEVNVSGDTINVDDAYDWVTAKDAASCIDGSYSSFFVRGLGTYMVEASVNNLKITLKWGIMISVAIPALTPGTLHYYIDFASSYAPGGYISYSGSNTIKFQIFNATTGKYVNIFTSTYFSDVAIGSYTITSHLISNGYVYLKAYFESIATIETDAGGYIQIPNIGSENRILIYQLYISRDPLSSTVYIEHQPEENYVYHHLQIYNPEYATKIVVDKPSNWDFYLISPNATVTEHADNITITDTIPATYDIYFTSSDFWNYPRRWKTHISYYDEKDDYIPFESLVTFYNLTWNETPWDTLDFEILYDDTFEMDPAQYLHIKVCDRWGDVLLEVGNLSYFAFYSFTITMYSFQIYNFQDDFIYFEIRKIGKSTWYGQYLAPREPLLLRLYPADYEFNITFANGTMLHETFTLNNDTMYLITGWTLTRIAEMFPKAIYFKFYNTLTGLGLPFEMFQVRVDGVEISSPIYETAKEKVYVEVYDYFARLLYENWVQVQNVTFLKIGFPVATITITNNYPWDANITLIYKETQGYVSLQLKQNETISLQVIYGTYELKVTKWNEKKLLKTMLISIDVPAYTINLSPELGPPKPPSPDQITFKILGKQFTVSKAMLRQAGWSILIGVASVTIGYIIKLRFLDPWFKKKQIKGEQLLKTILILIIVTIILLAASIIISTIF